MRPGPLGPPTLPPPPSPKRWRLLRYCSISSLAGLRYEYLKGSLRMSIHRSVIQACHGLRRRLHDIVLRYCSISTTPSLAVLMCSPRSVTMSLSLPRRHSRRSHKCARPTAISSSAASRSPAYAPTMKMNAGADGRAVGVRLARPHREEQQQPQEGPAAERREHRRDQRRQHGLACRSC